MDKNPKLCGVCGQRGSKYHCACMQVYYCGSDCQKAGWATHKPECAVHLAKKIKEKEGAAEGGGKNLAIAEDYYQMGLIHMDHGRLGKAKRSFKKVLEIRSKVLGRDHVDVASTLVSIGDIYDRQGRLDKALAKYAEGLKIPLQEDLLGGKLDEALKLRLNKALKIVCRVFGDNHMDVASIMSIAMFHAAQGRHDEALEMIEKGRGILISRAAADQYIQACECAGATVETWRGLEEPQKGKKNLRRARHFER